MKKKFKTLLARTGAKRQAKVRWIIDEIGCRMPDPVSVNGLAGRRNWFPAKWDNQDFPPVAIAQQLPNWYLKLLPEARKL